MPNKRVDNLKDECLRKNGQEWQEMLGIRDLTTREIDKAVYYMLECGMSKEEAARRILAERKR